MKAAEDLPIDIRSQLSSVQGASRLNGESTVQTRHEKAKPKGGYVPLISSALSSSMSTPGMMQWEK